MTNQPDLRPTQKAGTMKEQLRKALDDLQRLERMKGVDSDETNTARAKLQRLLKGEVIPASVFSARLKARDTKARGYPVLGGDETPQPGSEETLNALLDAKDHAAAVEARGHNLVESYHTKAYEHRDEGGYDHPDVKALKRSYLRHTKALDNARQAVGEALKAHLGEEAYNNRGNPWK